jgi:hypothetical protein
MTDLRRSGFWMFAAALLGWFSIFSTRVDAQSQGNDAVYNSNAKCSSTTSCGFSGAFIDASVFVSTANPNICALLNGILNGSLLGTQGYPTAGAVIDARGLSSNNTNMQCKGSPWAGITSPTPSTILLPAGTILIPKSWILPANTRLIGEGDNPYASSPAAGTTIQACKSPPNTCSFSDSAMIQFGSSSASGISVEKIALDGQGQVINGIVNSNSGAQTYVDRITLFQIFGVGLLLQSNASYSGPYTNITFDTGTTYAGQSQTTCAQLYNVTGGTHGIHGLTCMAQTADATSAVLLDSSNNSLEDITIAGFHSGIVLGSLGPAQSNVLFNVSDSTKACNPQCAPPINMVHIEANTTNGQPNVTDLSVMGASNGGPGTLTILDDLTSTQLSDTFVGIYALGKSSSGGYSRFTTSPNASAVTWAVGQSGPQSSCSTGSIYSCIGGSGNGCSYALYGCVNTSWHGIK